MDSTDNGTRLAGIQSLCPRLTVLGAPGDEISEPGQVITQLPVLQVQLLHLEADTLLIHLEADTL